MTAHKPSPIDDYNNRIKNRFKIILNEQIGFDELIGQVDVIGKLKAFGDLYQEKGESPEHILLLGPNGMGKRTIARAFAKRYLVGLYEVEGKALSDEHLLPLLSSIGMKEGVSIIDIQSLQVPIAERFPEALTTYTLSLEVGVGLGKTIHPFKLDRFTCIATAPRGKDLPAGLLEYFSLKVSLCKYSTAELEGIAVHRARHYDLSITPGVASLIVIASDGTPAGVESLMRRLARLGKGTLKEQEVLQVVSAFGLKTPHGDTGDQPNLDKLTGIDFERVVTSLLSRMGFDAEMTKASGDGGIDIVAELRKPLIGGRYLIQCKRFSPDVQVGAPVVREFYGAVKADQQATKGIFITTSGFSAQAKEFAGALPLELIDGERLVELLAEYPDKDELSTH